ncbi:uncharacterized protein SRS1_14233 [Sporisorium reilianum f. sp. reilianum]|uniref:Conserved oligomeric Golgi complex subunit 8 n=1 Tax=Sporisorium reilianum f. sp. reilianum TaxID=72559 RepID=A0A2N8UER4_9BASI|nr:uncharacterized protein SRS1_14233 [Sporisorium reilianum f. sp. reilianum]
MPSSIAAAATDTTSPGSLTSLIQNAASSTDSPLSPEALADKQVASYIRSLSNFSLTDLKTQPQQLQTKAEALHQQLSELCISQTDAFIHIHHAEQQFAPSLTTFATHLDDLIANTLPDLQAAADAFASASQPVLEERERVHNVADQYERGHLSDLLEIPPLVQTCVRVGHHSEAIQLAEHLVTLLKRSQDASSTSSSLDALHGQRSTYLSLLIETLSHLAIMKADLISSFSKSGLKLPAALKSVTILRRLNQFESSLPDLPEWQRVLATTQPDANPLVPQLSMSENQLCLAFLKARIRSFHSALDAMGSPSSFSSEAYLRRHIDLWREEMADTLGMAFPLFIDDAPSASHSDMVSPAYLVSSFATSGLQRLRDTISVQLATAAHRAQPASSASTASLETLADTFASIHTQLSYASAALTRFGLDFGTLLLAPSPPADADASTRSLSTLETTWLDALTVSLDHIFAHTHTQLDEHLHATDGAALPSRWLISAQLPASALEDMYRVSAADSSAYDDLTRPNIELVDFPLIAKLLNRLLEWVHALQVFAPVRLAPILLQRLSSHFESISQRLLADVPHAIAAIDTVTPHAHRLLADAEAQLHVQHLDAAQQRAMQIQIIRDRECAILAKVLAMWHASVVGWTLDVVGSRIFADVEGEGQAREAWGRAQEWIKAMQARVAENGKRRREEAAVRREVVEQAEADARARAKADAEEEARVKAAQEEARRQAEEQARLKAEEEARLQAEEEARLKAEQEARLKLEEEERLKAEEAARLKAQEEERLKAEAAAAAAAKAKAEAEAKAKAEAEAKASAEAEAAAAEAKAKAEAEEKARVEAAEQEARRKAEEEAKVKAEAEAEARAKAADAEAKARAAQAETESQTNNDDIQPSTKAEATTEEATKAIDEPAPSTAAPKKFSLAEKLRLRKEERDRAAAAAAAEAASSTPTEAPASLDESKDAEAAPLDESNEAKPAQEDDSHPSTEAASKEVDAAPAEQEDAVDDGENDDDEAAGEDDGSGANTPATPTTPNPESTSGSGASKKSKKKNKKKK